jgi:hypothetical protein
MGRCHGAQGYWIRRQAKVTVGHFAILKLREIAPDGLEKDGWMDGTVVRYLICFFIYIVVDFCFVAAIC